MTGSNGMAAGNTLPEATFQALCEIFERYAASLVYNNNLTPPTIDETYLKQYPEEYKIIQNISNKGFKVVIKDFSCGKKLPVIGVLIIDENSKKYRLNIGSDTNFQVALSRALTEIFQGMANLEIIGKFLVDMPTPISAPFFYKKMKEHKDTNLKYFFKNGLGIFPESLFGEKSSYQFDPDIFSPKDSYEKEVQQLLDLAKNNSMDVYMRDVSFLNFPSIYIYVPKISLLGKKDFTYKGDEVVEKLILFDELETLLYPFYDFIHDKNKIKRVIQIIEDLDLFFYADFKAKDLFRLNFGIKSKWYGLSLHFFMVYLYYLSENYVNAKKYLLIFMSETNQTENGYYKQIIEFFDCKINNLPTDKIDSQIIDGFKNADTLFSFISYPNCPDCNNCKLFEHCSTNRIINKFDILKSKFREVLINQNKFFSYYKS